MAVRDEEKVIPRQIGKRALQALSRSATRGVRRSRRSGRRTSATVPGLGQRETGPCRRPRSALVGSESGVPPPHRGPATRLFATHEKCRRRRLCASPSGGVDCVTLRGLTATLHTAADSRGGASRRSGDGLSPARPVALEKAEGPLFAGLRTRRPGLFRGSEHAATNTDASHAKKHAQGPRDGLPGRPRGRIGTCPGKAEGPLQRAFGER